MNSNKENTVTVLYQFGTKKRATYMLSILRQATRGRINVAAGLSVRPADTKTRPGFYELIYNGSKGAGQYLEGFMTAILVLEQGNMPKKLLDNCLKPL